MLDQWSAEEAAVLVESIAAVAVVIGLIFGLIQLKQSVRNRKNAAAVDIVRTVQTQEVRLAIRRIFDLPFDVDPKLIRENPELLAAALAVDSACEMWGCMVFEGVVDHRMLDRMVGGWIRGSWERLRVWVKSERDIANNQSIGEWWQWIYDIIEADPDPGKKTGAHIAYKGQVSKRLG